MERTIPSATSRWPAWLNAAVLLLASVVVVASLAFQVGPGTEAVAVVFPPWWTSRQIFEAVASAEAAVVRTTALSSMLVVRPNDRDGYSRLRRAGVWLTIDPQAIAACLNTRNKEI